MKDTYNRTINYLRISVTDRCNLRCIYCMPSKNIKWLKHEAILSFEEIIDVVKTSVDLGINKVRLTGGEPLMRKNILKCIEGISTISGINDFAMTTNGVLLKTYAKSLKSAGLERINISLDTLDPEKYAQLTGGGNIDAVLRGIDAALAAQLLPVKINCVVDQDATELNAKALKDFAVQKRLIIRFIPKMDFSNGHFSIVEGGSGGDCPNCNRLRLLADGTIRPCLFSNIGFNVREYGAKEAILKALQHKPEKGTPCIANMHSIGG